MLPALDVAHRRLPLSPPLPRPDISTQLRSSSLETLLLRRSCSNRSLPAACGLAPARSLPVRAATSCSLGAAAATLAGGGYAGSGLQTARSVPVACGGGGAGGGALEMLWSPEDSMLGLSIVRVRPNSLADADGADAGGGLAGDGEGACGSAGGGAAGGSLGAVPPAAAAAAAGSGSAGSGAGSFSAWRPSAALAAAAAAAATAAAASGARPAGPGGAGWSSEALPLVAEEQ